MPPVLSVQNLTVTRDQPVLEDISFNARADEILLVLGPSGAGKSTLLRALNRLDAIESGSVILNGTDTSKMAIKEVRRKMGMVFQVPAPVPGSVAYNIQLGPGLRGQHLDDIECEQLLERVGLASDFMNRQVQKLSIGEQQRVAFAQTLANRPDVLLLDEPTSALDPTAVLTIENLIKSVHEELKTSTIMVTHNLEQALRFNTDTLVLMEGRIAARGNINDLMASPGDTLKRFFEGRLNPEKKEPRDGI